MVVTREEGEGQDKPMVRNFISGVNDEDPEMERMLKIIEEANDFDWEIPQEIPEKDELLLSTTASYGFNGCYSGCFVHLQETCNEIIDVSDPERSTFESRRQDRCKAENDKFNPDHYIADFMGAQDIRHILKYKTKWTKELRRVQQNDASDVNITKTIGNAFMDLRNGEGQIEPTETGDVKSDTKDHENANDGTLKFTEKEKSMMLNLPNKLCEQFLKVYEGEINVESAWTMGKISPTISCLEKFATLKETIISLFRRSLAYPCYRNFELSERCLEDVYVLMKLGRRAILKVLLEMKDVFDHDDVYYIYSKIWIDDYCIWCQTKASDKVIRSLAHQLHHYKVFKSDIGWHLEEYEQVALEDQEMG
ncbi:9454_t:CDS:2 [Acaulospora colombiana]|uniref:9454_t:CDS:1 n=1 Tax=Acaulospora colombiana TaxID=27376 RepID=A0ACA9KS63_9GLOM|nr:9454_t:CDS:2 [Acaulospora colombiana]